MSDYLYPANGIPSLRSRRNLLNGVDFQYKATKPTTRSDGTTLVSGDRWLDSSNCWWFYNGTYWLSEQIFQSVVSSSSITATTAFGAFYPMSGYNVYIVDLQVAGVFLATQDTTANYWQILLDRANNVNPTVFTTISTLNCNTLSVSTNYIAANFSTTINTQVDVSALNVRMFRVVPNKVGSAGALQQFAITTRYRLCQP